MHQPAFAHLGSLTHTSGSSSRKPYTCGRVNKHLGVNAQHTQNFSPSLFWTHGRITCLTTRHPCSEGKRSTAGLLPARSLLLGDASVMLARRNSHLSVKSWLLLGPRTLSPRLREEQHPDRGSSPFVPQLCYVRRPWQRLVDISWDVASHRVTTWFPKQLAEAKWLLSVGILKHTKYSENKQLIASSSKPRLLVHADKHCCCGHIAPPICKRKGVRGICIHTRTRIRSPDALEKNKKGQQTTATHSLDKTYLLWEAPEGKIQLSTSEKPDPKPRCLANHHSSHPPHRPTAGTGGGNLTVSTNISGQETRIIICPGGKVLWSHAVAGKKLRCPQSSGLGNCPGTG